MNLLRLFKRTLVNRNKWEQIVWAVASSTALETGENTEDVVKRLKHKKGLDMTPEEKLAEAERLEKLAKSTKRDAAYADHGAYGQDMSYALDLGQRARKLRLEAETEGT